MTHTPGPWFVADWQNDFGDNKVTIEARLKDEVAPGRTSIWPDGIRKLYVASTEGSDGDALADARMISAAPQLYEYALAIEQWEADLIMDSEAWETGNPAIPQHLWDRWMKLQALRLSATAKARGTT